MPTKKKTKKFIPIDELSDQDCVYRMTFSTVQDSLHDITDIITDYAHLILTEIEVEE